jgi:hypothetical protein
MKKSAAKAVGISVAVIVAIAFCVVSAAIFQNWKLDRQVRSAFNLTGPHISAEEIQAFLDQRFPPGTPKQEIEAFLTAHFGKSNWLIATTSSNQQSLSCMADCGARALGTRDRMLLEFFFSIPEEKLQDIKVGERSIAM